MASNISTTEMKDAFAIATYSGEYLGKVDNVIVSDDAVAFKISDREFLFLANEDLAADESASSYTDKTGKLICSVVENAGNQCVQIANTSLSIAGQKADPLQAFTVFVGTGVTEKTAAITEAYRNVELENVRRNSDEVLSANYEEMYELMVLATGSGILNVMEYGTVQGFCNSCRIESDRCTVTDMEFFMHRVVAADGVSLWYNYQNSRQAWTSSTTAPNGLNVVSGSWPIDGRTGAFQASSTYKQIVSLVPVLLPIYDTVDIYGRSLN